MLETRRILIVEDQKIIREGLQALMSDVANFEVIGQAENGYDALRACRELKPDIILMDLSMPKMNGVESTRHIKRATPDVKVLILTSHCTEKCVRDSFMAGASGFLDKDCTREELLRAINCICLDEVYISNRITDVIVTGYLGETPELPESTWDKLTDRERQILKLVAEGARNRDIAERLFISQKTVEKHRANMMRKLNLHSVPALTAYCIERGFINGEELGY